MTDQQPPSPIDQPEKFFFVAAQCMRPDCLWSWPGACRLEMAIPGLVLQCPKCQSLTGVIRLVLQQGSAMTAYHEMISNEQSLPGAQFVTQQQTDGFALPHKMLKFLNVDLGKVIEGGNN